MKTGQSDARKWGSKYFVTRKGYEALGRQPRLPLGPADCPRCGAHLDEHAEKSPCGSKEPKA